MHISHTIEDGIERVVYKPDTPKYETPIVMQHGMWHGAWCWAGWQQRLAELGWETHAHSLPGHAGSPEGRPLRWCTLDYYMRFLRAEIERMPRKPVLMGHSMGGALTQRYLAQVADDLPAAVLVAAWNAHEMQSASLMVGLRDPVGLLLSALTLTTTPMMRSPQAAARVLISPNATVTPEDLYARVGGESMWVLLEYNPLMWRPKQHLRTPLLWLIPTRDQAVMPSTQTRSARFYGADTIHAPGAGHNLMMEPGDWPARIHEWLVETCS